MSEQHKWVWQRTTPRRKPGLPYATIVFQPFGFRSLSAKRNALRTPQRLKARAIYLHAFEREKAIGIDPVHSSAGAGFGRVFRDSAAHKAWQRKALEWDRQHPIASVI